MASRNKTAYIGNDRWMHDLMNGIMGIDGRKDALIDKGVKIHGSSHRKQYPHRSIEEACMHLCLMDIMTGKPPDIVDNFKLSAGHMFVDSVPSDIKTKMQLLALMGKM